MQDIQVRAKPGKGIAVRVAGKDLGTFSPRIFIYVASGWRVSRFAHTLQPDPNP